MPTPKFANLQKILAEEGETETGVVSERAGERLEAEMRRALIDFFERFFLWCALFRPVKGSRGMRAETLLTRFGKVRCGLRRTGDLGLCAGEDVLRTSGKLHEVIRVLQGLMAALERRIEK